MEFESNNYRWEKNTFVRETYVMIDIDLRFFF